jgi:hypothetical protein
MHGQIYISCSKYLHTAVCTLLISRSQIDSKSGVNKKGTERLFFGVNFTPFLLHFWSNFYSLSRLVFTLQGVNYSKNGVEKKDDVFEGCVRPHR